MVSMEMKPLSGLTSCVTLDVSNTSTKLVKPVPLTECPQACELNSFRPEDLLAFFGMRENSFSFLELDEMICCSQLQKCGLFFKDEDNLFGF
jgi:hypothetical protein